ncbi:hypothetical protein Taro_054534 [Colocasia esculenta]|uniref:adenine phosphoribosyltransferase n=1 Tax=Colocasia esculenta TaxID=4460 RepID=A0A843XQS7_COLES|nr:hypothetical protein [Colocasia esculenta]
MSLSSQSGPVIALMASTSVDLEIGGCHPVAFGAKATLAAAVISPPLSLLSTLVLLLLLLQLVPTQDSEESEGEKEKRAASIKYPGTEQKEAGEEEMVERSGENGVAAPVAVEEVAAAAGAAAVEDPRLQGISAAIRVVPHFPKPGIMFNDITTLLLRPKVFKDAVDILVDRYRDMAISAIAGIEARGFIFGPPVALALGAKFVPLRKPKKLPGEVISENYVLEYGTDCLEMHVGAVQPEDRVLVIDDLVATGGTLCAAIKLIGSLSVEWKASVYTCGVPPIDMI